MAIKGTFLFRGFAAQNAYVQARGMMLVGKSNVRGRGIIWTSQVESQSNENQPLDIVTFDFELTDLSTPIYDAAYAALKTMPQFSGFSDC